MLSVDQKKYLRMFLDDEISELNVAISHLKHHGFYLDYYVTKRDNLVSILNALEDEKES